MNEVTFPGASATAFTRKALETLASNPYPDYVKRNYYIKTSGDRFVMHVIYDIEKGKEEEGILDIMNRSCLFGTCIEGISGKFEPVMTLEQMLTVMGPIMSQEEQVAQ